MSKDSNALTLLDEPVESGVARFDTPAPSCLGGAHRRCLLDSETCSCACHRGVEVARVVAEQVWPCAVCGERFSSNVKRAYHFGQAHPIKGCDDLDSPLLEPVRERRRDHLCDGCKGRFLSVQGLRSHQGQKRCGVAYRIADAQLTRDVAEFERAIGDLEGEVMRASQSRGMVSP